jgi:hypothetical protein
MHEFRYASFDDYKMAEKAVGALLDHGASKDDISLIVPHDRDESHEGHAKHGVTTTSAADAGSGAAKGAGIGLVAGALGALASLLIPGFGLVTGGGALATALGAAAGTTAAGAVAGGVAGTLVDQGVDANIARDYEDALKRGGAILQFRTNEKLSGAEAEQLLLKYNATNVNAGSGIRNA